MFCLSKGFYANTYNTKHGIKMLEACYRERIGADKDGKTDQWPTAFSNIKA